MVVTENKKSVLRYFSVKFKKNVCLAYTETNMLPEVEWVQKLTLMDEVWVPSSQEKQNLTDSGVKVPINVVPIPLDIEKILQSV